MEALETRARINVALFSAVFRLNDGAPLPKIVGRTYRGHFYFGMIPVVYT